MKEVPTKLKPYIFDYTQPLKAGRTINPNEDYIREYTERIEKGWLNIPGGYSQFNKDWFLTKSGDMWHVTDYFIEHERLDEDDWIIHLMEKSWFNANTFMPAYIEALHRNKIKTVTFRAAY